MDLIDRRAAIDEFWSLDVELRPSAIDAILNMLNGLPSAERRGRWQKNEQYVFICSICGCEAYCDEFGEQELSTYCPDCGALMKGE